MTVNYADALQEVFAAGRIPDGYQGGTKAVKFSFHAASGKTLVVHESGCFNAGLPDAKDSFEAFQLLKNHPSSRATRIVLLPPR